MYLPYLHRRISEIESGLGDWTGLQHPNSDVINVAKIVAFELHLGHLRTPSVVPSEDGHIVFIWSSARFALEVEARAKDVTIWLHDRATEVVTNWIGQPSELNAKLTEILGVAQQ